MEKGKLRLGKDSSKRGRQVSKRERPEPGEITRKVVLRMLEEGVDRHGNPLAKAHCGA